MRREETRRQVTVTGDRAHGGHRRDVGRRLTPSGDGDGDGECDLPLSVPIRSYSDQARGRFALGRYQVAREAIAVRTRRRLRRVSAPVAEVVFVRAAGEARAANGVGSGL